MEKSWKWRSVSNMLSIILAVALGVLGFFKLKIWLAICCLLIFLLAAALSNYLLKPDPRGAELRDEDYKLSDEFELFPLMNGEYIKSGRTRSGKEIVIFRSYGKDGKVDIRRLPKENVRVIGDGGSSVRLFVGKKKIKGDILYSVFPSYKTDLLAEIHCKSVPAEK